MAQESKTERPTPRHRREAREEGRVAVSRDLSAGTGLLAACIAGQIWLPNAVARIAGATATTFRIAARRDFTASVAIDLATAWHKVAIGIIAPIVGTALVVGLLTGLAQTRLMFSLTPLQPTFDSLSPVNGFKRIFSLRGLVETAKSLLKVVLVSAVIAWALWSRRSDFARLSDCPTYQGLRLATDLLFYVLYRCGAMLLIIGLADYGYQYWEYERSLRMTRQQVKEELKRTEGDPHFRARRRQVRRTMLQQGISNQMPDADVVVTNPTHIAVALLYKPHMIAPRVVAKGRHLIARRILTIARKFAVPIIRDPLTARNLYKTTSIGDFIPTTMYQAVAEILAVIYRRRQAQRNRHKRYGSTERR